MTEQPKIYRLVMVSGPEPGRRYVVRQSSVLLGRDPKCRIQVDADGVADQQLAIRVHGEDAVLTVLDHAEPVSIRGEPVTERRLEQGDVLAMGGVQLEFQWVEPLPFYADRRRSLVERGAVAAVWGVIAAQVLLLAALAWVWVSRVPVPDGGAGAPDAAEPMGAEERWEGRELTRISRDVDALRGWVDDLAGHVESVAAIPEADLAATPGRETPEPADTVAASQQWLAEAREQIAAGDWRAAEILLDRAQQADPTQDGVYVTRARLYQQQGDYASALGQWELAVSHAGSAAALQEANAERTRLEDLIRRREADRIARDARARAEVDARARAEAEAQGRAGAGAGARAQPAEAQTPVSASPDGDGQTQPEDDAAASRRIRIDNVRRERFRNRENYEEIRLVRFDLAPRKSGADEVRAEAVRVEVEFYDRDVDSGEITRSRAPSPSNGLALAPDWPPEQVQTLSALYMVPRDFRRAEIQTLGVRRQYYGFVIRVFYQGHLQDEEAFPVTLLERARQTP